LKRRLLVFSGCRDRVETLCLEQSVGGEVPGWGFVRTAEGSSWACRALCVTRRPDVFSSSEGIGAT